MIFNKKMAKQPVGNEQPLFQNQQPPPQTPGRDIVGAVEQLTSVSRRLRVLEERYSNLDRRMQMGEQNMLSNHKTLNTEFKTTASDVSDLKKELDSIKETLKLVIKELKQCAKRDDVKVIEKYIDLWQPVKFVNRNQVEKMIKEALGKEE